MEIERVGLSPAEAGTIRACFEVMLAAERVDHPGEPWFTEQPFTGWMTVGWDGNPREAWLATDQGSAVGWYRLELPARENLDQGGLEIVVHPAARQRGIGRALLRHAAGRAAVRGRAVLNGGARDGSPGEAFARAAGAKPGQVEVQRMLDIGKLEKGKLARLRGPAARAAAGYSLVSWAGPVPEEYIEQTAAVYNGMADAPPGSGDRPRGMGRPAGPRARQRPRLRYGMREYTVAARHDDTGELAGLTEMSVDPADPGWGFQVYTVVTRNHRGHRLGLLLKMAMMELLATTEPQLERIVTWNGQSNDHMIAVNEAMGYTVFGPLNTGYRLDVAAVPGVPA